MLFFLPWRAIRLADQASPVLKETSRRKLSFSTFCGKLLGFHFLSFPLRRAPSPLQIHRRLLSLFRPDPQYGGGFVWIGRCGSTHSSGQVGERRLQGVSVLPWPLDAAHPWKVVGDTRHRHSVYAKGLPATGLLHRYVRSRDLPYQPANRVPLPNGGSRNGSTWRWAFVTYPRLRRVQAFHAQAPRVQVLVILGMAPSDISLCISLALSERPTCVWPRFLILCSTFFNLRYIFYLFSFLSPFWNHILYVLQWLIFSGRIYFPSDLYFSKENRGLLFFRRKWGFMVLILFDTNQNLESFGTINSLLQTWYISSVFDDSTYELFVRLLKTKIWVTEFFPAL